MRIWLLVFVLYVGNISAQTDREIRDYIKKYNHIARSFSKDGVPASITLAQGLIESKAGTSKLAKYNNHFGIKCFSTRCKTGHCVNITDDHIKDYFRKYTTVWESYKEHNLLLTKGKYKKLLKYGRDYRKWSHGLRSLGYATDKKYADNLIKIIETYELYKYD